MEKDIVAIVAKQLNEAQENCAIAQGNVFSIEQRLDAAKYVHEIYSEQLIKIEEMYDAITPE